MRVKQGNLTQECGSWIGHWSKQVIDPVSGVKRRKQLSKVIGPVAGISEKKARLLLRDLITEDAGLTGDGAITVESFIKSVWLPLHEGQWRPSSKETILYFLENIYERFKGVALASVDAVTLQTWVNTLAGARSGSSVRMIVAYLRSIFSEAVEQDFIRKNPARLLRLPKHLKVTAHPYLTLDEITALLEAATPLGVQTREFVLLRLMLVTGLRPSELFALKWADLDFTKDNATVLIHSSVHRGVLRPYTKTRGEGEAQRKALPELAVETLLSWFEQSPRQSPSDYVFPNSDGGFIHPGNYLHRVLQPLARQAKIEKPLTFQVLRRTVATHAQDLGTLKDVSEILGHKQMQTTQQVYVQVLAESVRNATDKLANKMLVHKPAKAIV